MNLPHRDFGWKFDLCGTDKTPDPQLISGFIDPPPNHIDVNYLEPPTNLFKTRGVYIVGIGLMLAINTFLMINIIFFDLSWSWHSLDPSIFMLFVSLAIFIWTPSYIRLDIGHPRDQPIRFNRHRRKVYFYRYKFDNMHPYGTKNWDIQPVSYNWDDLTAEVYRIHAPLEYGGIIEKVMIAVRKHDTNEVIDRLFLADDIEQGKHYWALARLFMQKGPEALPDFVSPPVDWNSDDSTNPFDQLAPKVKWPPEMDLESRTAPD